MDNRPGLSQTPGPGGDNTNYKSLAIKSLIESTPLLTADNCSMWQKKFEKLFKLRGIFAIMDDPDPLKCLEEDMNQEFVAHIIAELDSNTYNNIINNTNEDNAKLIWKSTQQHLASSPSANRARVFNGFLHLTMNANIDAFVTSVKVYLKKMTEVGIELPSDIIAYLVLFKFLTSMQSMKSQIMHITTEMNIDAVLNHLIQHKNEVIAQDDRAEPVNVALYRGPRCENGKHNPEVTSHLAKSCWFEFPELKPPNTHQRGKKSKTTQAKEAHFYSFFCGLNSNNNFPPTRFILDLGCSVHMLIDKEQFNHLTLSNGVGKIQTGKKDAAITIEGSGEVSLATKDAFITLSDAVWVPESTVNLISLGALMVKGASLQVNTSTNPSTFTLLKKDKVIMSGAIVNNLFVIDMTQDSSICYFSQADLSEIHRSLGHASIAKMEKFLNQPIPADLKNNFECLSCHKAKISAQPFKSLQGISSRCFEKIHWISWAPSLLLLREDTNIS